jgi:hypothetical protein
MLASRVNEQREANKCASRLLSHDLSINIAVLLVTHRVSFLRPSATVPAPSPNNTAALTCTPAGVRCAPST